MADGVEVKVTGAQELAASLGRTAAALIPAVDGVVKHAAQNVKDGMAADARQSPHFRRVADTVSYDRAYTVGGVGYQVGPDADRGGAAHLAGIMYFGGAHGGGGSVDVDAPLRREEPLMVKALEDLIGGIL